MKRRSYFLSFIAFLMIAGFSCTKEEDAPEPSVEFKTGEFNLGIEFLSTDTSLVVDTEFTIGIIAQPNSEKNITNVTISRKIDGGTPVDIVNASTSTQSLDSNWTFITSPIEGFYETFTVIVSDANDLSSSVSLTIFTLPSDPGIVVYEDRFLTSHQLDFGHFFSISNGLTYDTADCLTQEVQELIDFGYFDHVTYGHTLMSPDIAFLQTIYPSVENWTINNTTRFSETEITPGAFDAIETIEQFSIAIDNSVTEFDIEFAANNVEDQVIAFITNNETIGLLKIKEANSSANFGESTLTFDVKIEKKAN